MIDKYKCDGYNGGVFTSNGYLSEGKRVKPRKIDTPGILGVLITLVIFGYLAYVLFTF